jgi:hypothetical protein
MSSSKPMTPAEVCASQARQRAEHEEFQSAEQKIATVAAAHIAPEHIARAMDHVARSIAKAVKKGRATWDDFDDLSAEQYSDMFASVARDNSHVARKTPAAPAKPASLTERQAALRKAKPWY